MPGPTGWVHGPCADGPDTYDTRETEFTTRVARLARTEGRKSQRQPLQKGPVTEICDSRREKTVQNRREGLKKKKHCEQIDCMSLKVAHRQKEVDLSLKVLPPLKNR